MAQYALKFKIVELDTIMILLNKLLTLHSLQFAMTIRHPQMTVCHPNPLSAIHNTIVEVQPLCICCNKSKGPNIPRRHRSDVRLDVRGLTSDVRGLTSFTSVHLWGPETRAHQGPPSVIFYSPECPINLAGQSFLSVLLYSTGNSGIGRN